MSKGLDFRFCEMLVLFVLLPTIHAFKLLPIAPIPVLLGVTFYCIFSLYRDGYFHTERLWRFEAFMGIGPRVVVLFLASALGLLAVTWLFHPERLFGLVSDQTLRWAFIMVLYPLLSVVPQELVFRVFFFHRYRSLISESWLIVYSALFFGFMHIVYLNLPAVLLSTVGGYLFTLTWVRTRSLACVALEHTLYGSFIFTVGLGKYFML